MIVAVIVAILVVLGMKLLSFFPKFSRTKVSKPQWFINTCNLQITSLEELDDIYQIPFDTLRNKLVQLQKYSRSIATPLFIEQMTRYLTPPEREQLRKIGYDEKIPRIQDAVQINKSSTGAMVQALFQMIRKGNQNEAEVAGIVTRLDEEINSIGPQAIQFKDTTVIHDINDMWLHVLRELHPMFQNEIYPIKSFIKERLDKIFAADETHGNTLVVIPGCGIGGIPHYISTLCANYCSIDSIEYNMVKYLAQKYIYGNMARDQDSKIQIAPFALNYSNQLNTDKQCEIKDVNIDKEFSSNNVRMICGDFNEYIPNSCNSKYDKIVIVTVYFIDTAYNLLQYLSSIEKLQERSAKPIEWINIGPLKYGTNPLVQLTQQEFSKLRSLRGWNDVTEKIGMSKDTLTGYVTNSESLYQAYYQNLYFHTVFENRIDESKK